MFDMINIHLNNMYINFIQYVRHDRHEMQINTVYIEIFYVLLLFDLSNIHTAVHVFLIFHCIWHPYIRAEVLIQNFNQVRVQFL